MTREQLVLALQQEYAMRREENTRIFEQRTEQACAQCPGLRELLSTRRNALMSGVRRGLVAHEGPESNANLAQIMERYNLQVADALVKGGLSRDALQPIFTCQTCRDEGFVYEPGKRMCSCFAQELTDRLTRELGLGGQNPQTFETYDETLFSDEMIPSYGVSQRQLMNKNRNLCLAYADSFPHTETRDLLFIGQSGLGKTFLLRAIAHRITQRGMLPCYTSAYHLLEVARKAYFENDGELFKPMMEASLLLIDDLGTEPLMQNITITQLFNLLNERQLAGRRTVISTNLTISELKDRYTERISSRLLDSSGVRRLTFVGEDVRKHLKRKENA